MISLVSSEAYALLMLGLLGSIIFGVVVGVWQACSSRRKGGK
jgi:hypothetical protein